MADYVSAHTGEQIDNAVDRVLNGKVAPLDNSGKVPVNNLPDAVVKTDESGTIPSALIPDAEYVSAIMLASNWVGNEYSFEADYPHARYNIEVSVANTATVDQFDAAGKARIGSSATSNIFKALGDVPTVDIPVVVKAVKK